MEEVLNCGWGDPYFLLELLQNMYKPTFSQSLNFRDAISLKTCTYAPNLGDEALLSKIKEITKKTTGVDYEYIMVTNGATQAINSILRSFKRNLETDIVVTSKTGYPYYPQMVKNASLDHKRVNFKEWVKPEELKLIFGLNYMAIIDSPSNPFGDQINFRLEIPTVWDGVYHNTIYNACPIVKPHHDVYVGSFSKLLGLTGARVGWVATNNKGIFDAFFEDSLYENATVSKISQKMINNILESVDLDNFMRFGKNSLDQNRQTLHKLSGLLGTDVQERGMFYCAETDEKMFDLFDKANVNYIRFNIEDKQFIRLNIGQTQDILKKVVKAIKKTDGRLL